MANAVDRPLASVVHVDSPSKFYIRYQHNDVVYGELKRNIQLALGGKQKKSVKVNETDICAVKHGGIWKRATVSSYDMGLVYAFLIDEGMNITCSEGDVYLLEKNFTEYPPMVKRCHLSDIIAQKKNPYNWPKEATSYFLKEVKSRLTVKIWIRGEEWTMPDGYLSTPVDITFDERIRDGPLHPVRVIERTMSQLLLREKFAQYAVPPSEVTAMSAPIEDEEMSTITEHQDTADGTIDGEDVVKSWLPPVIPRKKRFRARPTHVDAMGQIYIQRFEDRFRVREMRQRFVSDFGDKEAAELDYPNIREDWKIGEECVAMCKEDASWYRGRVYKVKKTTRECGVLFVDFGSTESVPFSLIRTARRFAQYPMLAIRVILENVLPLSGQSLEMEWPDNVLDMIYNFLHYSNTTEVVVTVTTTRQQMPLLVKIENIRRDSGDNKVYVNFNKVIVESGLARRDRLTITNELQQDFSKFGCNIEAVPESENGSSVCSVAVNPFTDHNWYQYIGDRIGISVQSVFEFPRLCIHYEEGPLTSDEIKDLVQRAARNEPPVIRPQLSMPVLARYKKMWYRAYVRQIDEDDKVTVCFVDSQDIGECSVLRNIPADTLAIPVYSTVVSLPYCSDDPCEATKKLWDLIQHVHGPLYLDVHSYHELEQVVVGDIWIQEDGEEKLLYQELISRGVLY